MAQTVLGFLLSRGWLGVLTTGTLLTGFYLFFFLWRFNEMPAAVQAHIPRAMRAPALRMAARLDAMMGDFFRGRVPIMIAVGLLTAGALRACSVQYGVLIGVATGIAGLVPVLPLAVGFVPTVVSAYVSSAGSWEWVAAAAGVFLGIQLLDARVLTPLIQGRRSGLHPVSVVLSVLIGYHTAETFGVLVALPTACLVKVVFTEFILPPLRELAAE
jgi:predicted PurR-regulated permease PerM